MVSRLIAFVIAIVVALLVSSEPSAGAQANHEQERPPPDRVTTQDMYIAGFDREVAQANGFEVRTLPDGREYLVATDPSIPAPLVDPIKFGPCGYSYMFMYDDVNEYDWQTGFHVNDAAVAYYWYVDIYGPFGFHNTQQMSGGLAFRNDWTSGYRQTPADDNGYYRGYVYWPLSWAKLWFGAYCYSGGPWDEAYVY